MHGQTRESFFQKYGAFRYDIPRNYGHPLELNSAVGNNKCSKAYQLEKDQICEYEVFIDKGVFHVSKIPRG